MDRLMGRWLVMCIDKWEVFVVIVRDIWVIEAVVIG